MNFLFGMLAAFAIGILLAGALANSAISLSGNKKALE
jgi:hypothetical protein